MKWRVGRTLGRTIYIQVGDEPSKRDHFLGLMESRDLAETVVTAINEEYAAVEDVLNRSRLSRQMLAEQVSDLDWYHDGFERPMVLLSEVLALINPPN